MDELSKPPSIGAVITQQFNEIGIKSADEPASAGSKDAWHKIHPLTSPPVFIG